MRLLSLTSLIAVVLLAAGMVFLLMGKETAAPDFQVIRLQADSLDTRRQLIEVNADSLVRHLGLLKSRNGEVLEYADDGNRIVISCMPYHEGAFNRLLLMGLSLHTYGKIKNTGLDIDTEKYRFSISTRRYDGIRFAALPVEILQSILLSNNP